MNDYNKGLLPEPCMRLPYGWGEEWKSIELGDGTGYVRLDVMRGTCRMETAEDCQNWHSCSECNADYYTDQSINFCPSCGRRVVDE